MTTTTDKTLTKFIAAAIGIPLVLIIMLLSYLLPMLNSGPEDLPVAIAGPEQVTSQLTAALDNQSPDTFEFTNYDVAEDARSAVENHDAIGAITVDAQHVTIVGASGAGTPYMTLMQQLGAGFEAQGMTVEYDDVAPLPDEDPQGSVLGTLGLPLAFGGNVSAIIMIFALKRHPWARIFGTFAVAGIAGFSTIALLQFGFGVLAGPYALTSFALSMGIAAIALTLQGLHNLFGMPGLGIAGVLLLFFSNPLAGLATGPWWLPGAWGAIGQAMPIGAAGSAIRYAAYFNGTSIGSPLWILTAWILVGLALSLFAIWKDSRQPVTATSADDILVASP